MGFEGFFLATASVYLLDWCLKGGRHGDISLWLPAVLVIPDPKPGLEAPPEVARSAAPTDRPRIVECRRRDQRC